MIYRRYKASLEDENPPKSLKEFDSSKTPLLLPDDSAADRIGAEDKMTEEFHEATGRDYTKLFLSPPPDLADIHTCYEAAVPKSLYRSHPVKRMVSAIKKHLSDSGEVKAILKQCPGLTLDQVGALVYYTSDIRPFGGKYETNTFKLLNMALVSRDPEQIEPWRPFLYHALSAQKFLPPFIGTTYRGLDKPVSGLSKQYAHGGEVSWVAFSSSTKNKKQMENFSTKGIKYGTWMVIEGRSGIEVPFSLFPNEEEVLFFPNTKFSVKSVLTNELKEMVVGHANLDILHLQEQDPTMQSRIRPITLD